MQPNRRRRLAIFGTFDVENYGDLLFPLVAQQRLAGHGIDVVPVSPTAGPTRYRDALPPISQAEFFDQIDEFCAVLIGGGNIIHLRDFGLPHYPQTAYPALWIGTTAAAAERGIPVLWNAPGVLAPSRSASSPDWLQKTVAAADHYAVRDVTSAEDLAHWSGRRPQVVPDTALDLPMLWPAEALADRFRAIREEHAIPHDRPVVALHVKHRSLAGQDVTGFSRMLTDALDRTGAFAILLAIGRCHGDHEVAGAIEAATGTNVVSFADAIRLHDIAAVLAGADAYLGASLHGHITAAAYGTPARLIAVPALTKFLGQAIQMDRTGDVVKNWATALTDLPDVIGQGRRPLPTGIKTALDKHWEDVTSIIESDARPKKQKVFAEIDLTAALVSAMNYATATSAAPKSSVNSGAYPMQSSAEDPKSFTNASADWDAREVDQLVSKGDFASATVRIRTALETQPDLLPARMAEVRLALGQSETETAVRLARALVREHAQNPWVWLLHVQSLAAVGNHEDAIATFVKGSVELQPSETAIMGAVNSLLPVLPMRDQVRVLQAALSAVPDKQQLQLRLAMRAHAVGEYRLSHDMLNAAERAGPLPDYARRLRSRLFPMLGPMNEAADVVLSNVADGAEDLETLARACRYAAAAGRFDAAKAAMFKLLELHPLEHRTVYRLNRIFLTETQDKEILRELLAKASQRDPGASWWLQVAFFALRCGEKTVGRDILDRLSDDPVAASMASPLLAALDALEASPPRQDVVGDADVRVVEVPGAHATIILFGGFQGGLSLIHDRYLDALLQKVPAHVVYLRDPYGRAFLNGIPELGASEDAMHNSLNALAAQLGSQRIMTIGGSIAGYAALRAGLALGAGRVVSLAGLVTPGSLHPSEPDHTRHGMAELFGSDLEAFDLRPALARQSDLRFVHVVGENYAPDLLRSRGISDLDNTEIHVLPGVSSHHVALPAVADGTLFRVLMEGISG